jgi:hypothetical protein
LHSVTAIDIREFTGDGVCLSDADHSINRATITKIDFLWIITWPAALPIDAGFTGFTIAGDGANAAHLIGLVTILT